jgi:hypothetical protein
MFDETVEIARPTGSIRVMTAADLRSLGYPGPGGDLYCCLEISPHPQLVELPTAEVVRNLARVLSPNDPASPVVVSWLELAAAATSAAPPVESPSSPTG